VDQTRKATIFTVGEDWDRLTADERIELCKSMSEDALRFAEGDGSEKLRAMYRELSLQWAAIAEELQRESARKT
jgi:hypothetical protein